MHASTSLSELLRPKRLSDLIQPGSVVAPLERMVRGGCQSLASQLAQRVWPRSSTSGFPTSARSTITLTLSSPRRWSQKVRLAGGHDIPKGKSEMRHNTSYCNGKVYNDAKTVCRLDG